MAQAKVVRASGVRQIVGISMAPEMAREFKAEAGRRGISLRALFEELWASYSAAPKR